MLADNLVIGGMTAFSTVDYPQHLATTLFLQGCPWRCHYCHNPHLIPLKPLDGAPTWQRVCSHLKRRKGLLDAVVFSGGEPTIQKALLPALQQTRDMGFRNGLHTGAPSLKSLRPLLPWLDWVGLDIKALPSGYQPVTTCSRSGIDSWAAIDVLRDSGVNFECRMTWHGALHSIEQVLGISRELANRGVKRFSVQVARTAQMLNPTLGNSYIATPDIEKLRYALAAVSEEFDVRA
ncbi:anaerobic ribonucleoside-triphosphate reductase activating protein [Marinobacter sp. 1-4A]|uniref:anaerobic ribonucleoside-triphosphate reductase activating protein n=1 Tax=unclassified Marinobacter TaxID=83889 RepID=UPI0019048BF9|nr:anaerobic ribonucleoside-triphosphate reductase activating protein [Marinobacter sp. 1-4A]MBK1852019.1 anaerobic ribonucleoside-triphosphate reductase activating protein [Marinobacter sp. 1-4A]